MGIVSERHVQFETGQLVVGKGVGVKMVGVGREGVEMEKGSGF